MFPAQPRQELSIIVSLQSAADPHTIIKLSSYYLLVVVVSPFSAARLASLHISALGAGDGDWALV